MGGLKSATAPKGPSVAIVDNDEHMRSALCSLLRASGMVPTAFSRAAGLLDTPLDYAAIVSDVDMPGLSGLDLARQVKAQAPGVPVILMTAVLDETLSRQAAACGVRHLIEKPFDLGGLLEKLEALVREPRSST